MSKVTVEELLSRVTERFGAKLSCVLANGELTVELAPSDLVAVCYCLRDEHDFMFEQLMDVSGVDYLTYGQSEWATNTATREGFSRGIASFGADHPTPDHRGRFAVVYHLLSVTHNQRIRLRVFLHSEPPRIPTVTEVWPSADWYEREAFDLFGILFDGHNDLRRILTDYGFIGHPFRKDFPLIGQVEMRYDATEGRVIYEPVSIKPRTLVPRVIRTVGADRCVRPNDNPGDAHTNPVEKTNG